VPFTTAMPPTTSSGLPSSLPLPLIRSMPAPTRTFAAAPEMVPFTTASPPATSSGLSLRLPLSSRVPPSTRTLEVRWLSPSNSRMPEVTVAPPKLLSPDRRSQPAPDLVSRPGPPMSLVQSSHAPPSQVLMPPAAAFITTSVSTRSWP